MGTSIKHSGSSFDEFVNRVNRLSKKTTVSFAELFNETFMREYTKCSSFDEFLESGGFKVTSIEDFKAIPDAEFDDYIHRNTAFESWKDMQKQAHAYWIKKQLNS